MLQTLNIQNVALIDKATLNFNERLNVISGETGAGKSILLDSLSFVFGGRADRNLIREKEKAMKVEAIFSNLKRSQARFIKENFSIEADEELFVSRELDVNGKNTCKINGELVPVATVKKICSMLADIHGQSEHLAILDNAYQLKSIDLYAKMPESLFLKLAAQIEEYKENEKAIKLLGGSETEKQNLIDLYSYQVQEIENAKITETEFDELTNEKKQMSAYEKINENLKLSYQAGVKSGFEKSASEQMDVIKKSLQSIEVYDEGYSALLERVKSCIIELNDICDTINDKLNANVFDEQRFEWVDSRLDFIKTMFRKYGGNFENLNKYYQEISNKLENLLNSNKKYEKLLENKKIILEKINLIQNEISNKRKIAAKDLAKNLENELKVLGMPNAKMEINFSKIAEEFSYDGFDFVEFMFSANLGFELKPLNKVVSGGEMSRVVLAYKILLSGVDEIHTIVFDEIDSGLSGNIASVVAEYMARLSINKQVLAVSHLPQICAMADQNIHVSKSSYGGRTNSQSVVLQGDKLLLEIARLMGVGSDELGLKTGLQLKSKCEAYKTNLKIK